MPNLELTTLAGYAPNKVLKPVNGLLTWAADDGITPSNNVKIVQGGANVDVGALVNAADTALGALPGEIRVYGGGNITTSIILGSNHKLKLHDGTYISKCPSTPIYMKDNSSVEGASWNTIIIERTNTDAAPADYRIIQAYNLVLELPRRDGGPLNNTAQSDNLTVKNIQFKGVKTNPHDGGNNPAIVLGNCHQGRVENCWFNEISGYACQFGANSVADKYAKDGWYLNNLHTNLQSQNVAITNGENILIEGNIFKDPGKLPYTVMGATNASPIVLTLSEPHHLIDGRTAAIRRVEGNTAANGTFIVTKVSPTQISLNGSNGTTSGAFSGTAGELIVLASAGAAIDIEPNGDAHPTLGERIINIIIKNNIFDFRNMHTNFTAIAYQIVGGGRNEGAVIEGNIMLGNETGAGQAVTGIYLGYPNTHGVTISNNYIYKFSQKGMLLRGTRIKASNNQVIHCGGGGTSAIEATDLEYSTISNNTAVYVFDTSRGVGTPSYVEQGNPYIWEMGMNRFNIWSNNVCSRHQHIGGNGTGFNSGLAWSVTDSIYKNNTAVGINGGMDEALNSNRNTFDGNMTDSKSGGLGLLLYGTASKVISHKHTDGSIFFGQKRTTLN